MQIPIQKIITLPKIQVDTVVSVYLLKAFGGEMFPGIENAQVDFLTGVPEGKKWDELEKEGTLLVDIGGGRFDHHPQDGDKTVSELVAEHLNLDGAPILRKLITWVRRDDIEGKGTISNDPIDRAFGMSGLIMSANRHYPEEPQKVLDVALPLIDLHVREEIRRQVELPKLWDNLRKEGKASTLKLKQGNKNVNVMVIESDNVSLPGFLRAAKYADIVVQKRSAGHINIITKQARKIDLSCIMKEMRIKEAQKKGISLKGGVNNMSSLGRLDEIPEWFYDTAANTIQNGGFNPKDTVPTKLSKEEVVDIIKRCINS